MVDDTSGLRRKGRLQMTAGALISLLGAAGLALLASGVIPGVRQSTFFPIVALIAGLGILDLGCSATREAGTLERERKLRAARTPSIRR